MLKGSTKLYGIGHRAGLGQVGRPASVTVLW
jgi:hypothetical protein